MTGSRRCAGKLGLCAMVVCVALVVPLDSAAQSGCAAMPGTLTCGTWNDLAGNAFLGAISNACAAKLMTPCDADGHYFCPGEFVSREDAAVFIERARRIDRKVGGTGSHENRAAHAG